MKTRTLGLPLVILIGLIWGGSIRAQQVAHFQLFTYLEKIPSVPDFPDNANLKSTEPTSFEDNNDIIALEKKVQSLGKALAPGSMQLGNPGEASKEASAATLESEAPVVKKMLDSLQSALKEMQSVKINFTANFKRLEDVYAKRVEKVELNARALASEHPCMDDAGCRAEQLRTKNTNLIAATREKIVSEEYLLGVYISQVKASFKSLDEILRNANYGEQAISREAHIIFHGAQQDQILLLTDILERLKLERITISNCARLAQQGK
ncbi:MAG: hypothetical protein Q8896_08765 [Bacteroidota bacterium]|nr:hypothetical protein [Bacteroidota bacterium]